MQTSPLHETVAFVTGAQSNAPMQPAPGAHFRAQLPPQSTAVSSPSLIRSVHEAAQEPFVQSALMQWEPLVHPLPNPHFAGQLPPQSTSVSSPSRTPFEHALAMHAPAAQIPLAQSPAVPHGAALGHLRGQGPPQSTDVSLPFRTSSPQDASWQMPRMHDKALAHGLLLSSQIEPGGAPHAASSSAGI